MVRLHTILSHKEYSQQRTYKSLKSFSNIKNQILKLEKIIKIYFMILQIEFLKRY